MSTGSQHRRPLVGITTDVVVAANGRLKSDCGAAYAECIARAGGVPVLLPALPELAAEHVCLCDAFVLTGGDDPRTEPFGQPTHPEAKPIHERRQSYETQLLTILQKERPETPVLGVCLGMQMMSLLAGGRLNQHLPETHKTAAEHKGTHAIVPEAAPSPIQLTAGSSLSSHHQAVAHPGSLHVLAHAHDGVIEAVADPKRPFYVGVQWHPERTEDRNLGQAIFDQLVAAARCK